MQKVETNHFRQILKVLADVSEVIQRNSERNRIRTASRQTIKARKQRNLSFPNRGLAKGKRKLMKRGYDWEEHFYHKHETDQN